MADRFPAHLVPITLLVLLVLLPGTTAAQDPRRPLVFVPGILGSRLVDPDGEVVWGGVSSYLKFSELRLPRDPAAIRLRASGIIETIPVVWPWKIKQYDALVKRLEAIGYVRGQNLFLFAYDWRRSNYTTAEQLQAFVAATPQLASGRFDLLAHSMGGLVSWIFIHEQAGGARVENLVTLGTPFFGSVNAVDAFLSGFGGLSGWMSTLGSDVEDVRSAMFSFESGYELLPSYAKCCVLGSRSDPAREPIDLLDAGFWTSRWLPKGFDAADDIAFVRSRLEGARELQDLVRKPLPESTRFYAFAGDKFDTRTQFWIEPDGAVRDYRDRGGDGTVWLTSAARNRVADSRVSFAPHATIFDDRGLEVELQRILAPTTELQDFAASAGDVTFLTADGMVEVESVRFEVSPPIAATGQTVVVRASLRGVAVALSEAAIPLRVCVRSPKLAAPKCADLEEVAAPGGRVFEGRFSFTEASHYAARLEQRTELEDYFVVLEAPQ